MKKVLSISDYFFFNRFNLLFGASYFNSLYSIWNERRRKPFHDSRRPPWKKESSSLNLLYFYLFIFRTPTKVDSKTSYFNYLFLLSSIFCLSLFHLVKLHACSLFKKVRPNPTNKTVLITNLDSSKNIFRFLHNELCTIPFSIY